MERVIAWKKIVKRSIFFTLLPPKVLSHLCPSLKSFFFCSPRVLPPSLYLYSTVALFPFLSPSDQSPPQLSQVYAVKQNI